MVRSSQWVLGAMSLALVGCFSVPDTVDSAAGSSGGATTGGDSQGETGTPDSGTGADNAPDDGADDAPDDGADDGATGAVDSGSGADDGDTGNATTPDFCDPPDAGLATCDPAVEGQPAYGSLACDPGDPAFQTFYEDVFAVTLSAGDCFSVRVDNVAQGGATGVAAADVALQIRSPSGAYTFADDDVPCTDPTWTEVGTCPAVSVTADQDGIFELSVVQASGAGCVSGAPYSVFAAVNGTVLTFPATPDFDDRLLDCAAG